MPWPFTNGTIAPNFDTTPGQALPAGATAITAAQVWLMGGEFSNRSGAPVRVIVTNTNGDTLYDNVLPDGADDRPAWPFRPALGLKWSGNGVKGQLWGLQ